MVSLPIDLAKTYLKELIDGAIARSRYICCFTCITKEFEEEKVRLKVERTTVGQRVNVATDRGDIIQNNVHHWEEQADELDQEDTKTKQKCLFGFCPNCKWRYKRGKELANRLEIIKELVKRGQNLEIGLHARLPGIERHTSQYYISFESRESKFKDLLEFLKDDQNYIIGLQGMGGVGKTTLAKEVGKALKRSKQFSQVIDTRVSFSPNIKKIQDDISGPLGLVFGESCNEADRPKKLWNRLTNGEKILLILDDVWGNIDFDDIGIPCSDNHKGCKVLITTRNLRVCNINGCGRTVQLELLSEEDAWIMFKRYNSKSNDLSKNVLTIAKNISNECKGLPVAISIIASSLRAQQHLVEWEEALKSLQKPMFGHGVDDNLVDIYKCLRFSYDNMKDENAKRLFLLCSVFQEDGEISIEVLTRFAIGVGILGEGYDSYEDARRQVELAKNKLLDSCLLLETNERSIVKMHDLVREVAQWISNKEIQAIDLSNKNQKSLIERENDIKYLLCESKLIDVFSCTFDGSKLEILIVDMDTSDSVDIPSSFFENIADLRVLHLSYQDQPTIPLLRPIQSLRNIRSLLFGRVDLGDISILGKLQTLETLDLVWCKIDKLPPEIAKLEKLKLLNLVFCEVRSENPFEVIKSCSSLEELYFLHSFNDSCRVTLPALKKYHVCKSWAIINDSLSKCVAFEGDGDAELFLEATFKYLMQTAEVLQLSRIEGKWRNLIPEIVSIDRGMNDLVEFRLRYDSQLQCLIDTKDIGSQLPNVFSKLVVLHLYEINNLEVLCNGPLSSDSLKNLEELSVECCEELKSLFNFKVNLCNLKTMTLEACPMLVSLFQSSTSLSLLEELKIIDCEKLKNIISCDNDIMSHNSMFPNLKVVDIERCPLLKEPQLHDSPNFSSHRAMSLSVKESFSKDDPKAQMELDPVKCNCFSWTCIFCCSHKLKSTSTEIPVVSDDQQGCSITLSMKETQGHHISESSTSRNTITTILSNNSQTRIEPHISLVAPRQKRLNEIDDQNIQEGSTSMSEKIVASNSSIASETTNNEPPIQGIEISVEEGTTSASNAKAITSSTHLELDLLNEQSTRQQCLVKPFPEKNCLKATEDQSIQEGSISQKPVATTLLAISETTVPIQFVAPKQKSIMANVEEGTKLAKTITSSTLSESVSSSSVKLAMQSIMEQDVDAKDSQETTKINNDQVSLNDAVVMNVSSIIEEQFPKDGEFIVPESRPSPSNSIPLPHTYQTPSMPPEGNPSQIVEDSSSSSLVMRELEQLVSKKHLNYENLSLLIDFLVKHPQVLLRDTSLSNRYKSYAYNCLAELLKFLQTHSVLDVLGSSRSEFDELLQDVHKCGFDKDWLDGVEKRALSPDLPFSQDALQKVLDPQQQVTKEVEAMLLKINIFTQHVEELKHQLTSSKAALDSIIQHEAQILEIKAALSAPLGY
ncbi:disease resistance protein SUMM2-like [Trifolium pratense]|uniref:disease resistance protein SUMM2-like n=1 Tax=Trifolium pratense TaxID=57577 RepID=UPI001E690CDB|nr:disease resistance protein SUMM2-like [Trifolium pratense]XP_045820411.1 disease resistance protein SUMM2-like [Trifolium pratense]XP_045820412.1 disease resistance protein SUMM2-like [Trifolium pratense]